MPENQEWKAYEEAIYRYYAKQPNCTVKRNITLPTQNGRLRQIDVYLEVKSPPDFVFRIAIEAKHYGRKIDSDTFDAIRTRFQSVGVDMGMIFCPEGLESGPAKDLEGYTNPRMVFRQKTLNDLLAENWGDDVLIAIDNMAAAKENAEPSELVQEDVIATIERVPLFARFFFYKLDNPAWLPILASRGVLRRSLKGENQIPPLLACEYVTKFVAQHPDIFLEFSESVSESFHWLETDLLSAASQLPEALKPRFVEIASSWPFANLIETQPIADLVREQVRAGNAEQAFGLLSHVTRIQVRESGNKVLGGWVEVESPLQDYWFKELTLTLLPQMVVDDPAAVVDYARARMLEALRLKRPYEPDVLPTLGGVANLALEGQFGPLGVLETLVYTYRDVLVKLGERRPDLLLERIKQDLIGKENGALVRTSLYAAGETAQVRLVATELALYADWLWHDYNVVPELEHLVKRSWPDLAEERREAIVDRVMNLGTFSYRSDNISPEDAERYRKGHVIDWLFLLQELGLPPSKQEAAMEMRTAYSAETHKTKRFEHEGIIGGIVDPVPEDARSFAEKTVEEILSYCATFQPKTVDFLKQETPNGVAQQLRPEVARRPAEFLYHEDDILRLPYPAFHSAIADGLTDALRNNIEVDRVMAANLLARFVTQVSYPPASDRRRDSFDYGDARWVRGSVARFVDQAAQSDPNPLGSQESLFYLWELLWKDADVTPSVQGDVDALTEVINSEGGHLSMALCRLTLRCLGRPTTDLTPEEDETRQAWAARLVGLIDTALLTSDAPVVRAPLGLFFTGFFVTNRSWAEERTDSIFERGKLQLWEAAWSCYFWVTQRYKDVFLHLRDQYNHALEVASEQGGDRKEWIDRMGDDFAIFWMASVLTEDDPLVKKFWHMAPARAKRSAASWINANLKEETWDALWPRAREWWQMAHDHRARDGADEQSAVFLYWLDGAPKELTIGEIEPMLVAGVEGQEHYLGDHVLNFLEDRATTEPMECARLIRAIARNGKLGMSLALDTRMKSLMVAVHEAGDEAVKADLMESKKAFVEAGLFSFRDVLPDQPC